MFLYLDTQHNKLYNINIVSTQGETNKHKTFNKKNTVQIQSNIKKIKKQNFFFAKKKLICGVFKSYRKSRASVLRYAGVEVPTESVPTESAPTELVPTELVAFRCVT